MAGAVDYRRDEEQERRDSEVLAEKLASGNPAYEKQAADTLTDITRLMIREDGFYRETMQPRTIAANEFTKDWRTTRPVKVVELEPRSPAAMIVPIGGAPMAMYIRAQRYPVVMYRYSTFKFMVDVAELLTWSADLRRIISDNSIRDLQAEEDLNYLIAINRAIVGADEIVPTSGVAQYRTIPGSAGDKEAWAEAMKTLPATMASLSPKYVIVNNVTIWDLCKMTPVEIGPTIAEEISRKGWTMTEFLGQQLIVTIKKGLVPDRNIYMVADPLYVGKAYFAEDVVMHVKRDGHMVSFYSTMYGGSAIGNVCGVGRAVFDG